MSLLFSGPQFVKKMKEHAKEVTGRIAIWTKSFKKIEGMPQSGAGCDTATNSNICVFASSCFDNGALALFILSTHCSKFHVSLNL